MYVEVEDLFFDQVQLGPKLLTLDVPYNKSFFLPSLSHFKMFTLFLKLALMLQPLLRRSCLVVTFSTCA